MLHLRLTLPAERTAEIVALLESDVGVASLAVLPGCSIKPAGDVVLADIAREVADELLDTLRDRRIDQVGTITLDAIDTSVSRAAERAEEDAPGDGADAVIWEQVIRQTYADSALSVVYVAFLTIATALAAVAIVVDSAVLVVGAMVLGPEFVAIAALAVGIVHRRPRLLRRAAVTLVAGFAVAILVVTALGLVAHAIGWIDAAAIEGSRPQTRFIVTPDKWSLVVALLAGVAGVLSLTASKAGALVGVFISVTTVPAAANVALAIALGDGAELWPSLLQLGVNIGALLVSGTLTMLVQRAVWHRTSLPLPRSAGPHHP